MYYEEEYPYYEPTIADEIFIEYQQKMKDALLESVRQEIEQIKKENGSLKVSNKVLRDQISGISQREKQLEIDKQNLERQVRRERLSSLMKDFEIVMYRVDTIYPLPPKCDKCNEKRQIEFKSPSGKDMTEYCSCNTGKIFYAPQEYICKEFRVDRNDGAMRMWYKENHEKDYDWYGYEGSDLAKVVYKDGMNYEDLDRDIFFKSIEECQKYCNWLNENSDKTFSMTSSKVKKKCID